MNVRSERLGPLSRRHVLQMIGATGSVLLAGCRQSTASPMLMAPAGVLPKPWADALSKPWQLTLAPSQQDWTPEDRARADLLVMGDGWLDSMPADALQPIAAEPLRRQLDSQAEALLGELGHLVVVGGEQAQGREILAVVGESGCGKSTLLKILSQELWQETGSIYFAENLKVAYFDQEKQKVDKKHRLLYLHTDFTSRTF